MIEFKVGEYYTGICDEIGVKAFGDSRAMMFGFTVGDFRGYTKVFLGSDKVGKDGLTNDERLQRDLKSFGCTDEGLFGSDIGGHIRSVMIGAEIQFKAEDYKGEIQFSGCRVPGSFQESPVEPITGSLWGSKRPAPKSGGIF